MKKAKEMELREVIFNAIMDINNKEYKSDPSVYVDKIIEIFKKWIKINKVQIGRDDVKILNIYSQEAWHTDARIIGNKEGLIELRDTINNVLQGESPRKAQTLESEPLFASDGEGYAIIIERHDDNWGLKGGKDSFWNKEESYPQYIIMERKNK